MRRRHGLSQGALAYRVGTAQQAISRVEQGKVSPTLDLLERLAHACGEELVLDAPRARFRSLEISARTPVQERTELALS